LSGTFSIGKAQTKLRTNEKPANAETSRDKVYAELFRRTRGAEFAQLLRKNVGAGEVESIENWLDEGNAGFFRVFDSAYRTETWRVFEEKRKKNMPGASIVSPPTVPKATSVPKSTVPPKSAVPTKRKTVSLRGAAFAPSMDSVFFRNASYNSLPADSFARTLGDSFEQTSEQDEPTITKIETDDGFQMTGVVAESTKIDGDLTVTRSEKANARAIMVEGGTVGDETTSVQFVEAVNKKERRSLRKETTISWRVLTASCPDADGISAGSATITNSVKTTITNPQTIAVLTRDITVRINSKGFVDDAAELTHFDMEGAAVETISGYDRAERLGLTENSQFADGTRRLNYQIQNNKPGTTVKNEYGYDKKIDGKLGEVKVTAAPGLSTADIRRIEEIAGFNVGWLYTQVDNYLEIARLSWRSGGCVEVTLKTPKMKLLPAESAEVSAETVHKFDKNKVNAELTLQTATESALPDKYTAVTQGTFTLTAPRKGEKAFISVNSVSRRGINFEILQFDEEKVKKNPVKPTKTPPIKKCGGAWSGKITAVKRKREEEVKPASGRLVRQVNSDDETFSIDYHLLGIQDTSKNLANGYFAEAKMNYRSVTYTESNYAPGEMMCDKRIITTPQTLKMEIVRTAASDKRLTVYVSVGGEKGYLTFGSPEVEAEQTVTRTYETKCPSYDQTNSGVDRNDRLIKIVNPSFEIKFELDAKSAYRLVGSKTIQNSDGSETIVTWNLTRDCK
jgi:hypothetical protein